MTKKNILSTVLISLLFLPSFSQANKQEAELRREITLYNPYKPSLADFRKKSFLPDINDTASVKVSFSYEIRPNAFSPAYTLAPIKPASLLPDPLPKLYKSYVKVGFGNYSTPLAEISITNERSRKGAVGFYGRHYSSNGKVPLENKLRVFAGFMENEGSLFARNFFNKSILGGSVNLIQNTRYAYGYSPELLPYIPDKKSIKISYYDIGGNISFSSLNLDSTSFSYDFDLDYDYFHNSEYLYQHHAGISGKMAKMFEGFYVGASAGYQYYRLSDSILAHPKYYFSAAPFLRRSTGQWNFNIGLQLLLERNVSSTAKLHLYPDVTFGFNIVPEYIKFFAGLNGKLEMNDPLKASGINPFIKPDGTLFKLPNTDHALIISAGLKGNSGIGGNYELSVAYSMINDLLLFANIVHPDSASVPAERGNHFIPRPDDAELLNIHGELSGEFTRRVSFLASANYYKYTLTGNDYPWNKPEWDGRLTLKYNLRDKIIAGADFTLLGPSKLMSMKSTTGWMTLSPGQPYIKKPVHLNLGLSAEYRYTRILSFWVKINNISWNRYYEWAYYPSQMFNFMIGFSYSL